MRDKTTVIGNISDVAERFGVDGADVWEIIIRDLTLTNPDGVRVGLVADPDERQGTMWIVREVPR